MIEAHSPEQIRAAEARCGDDLAGGELMRRASTGLAAVASARLTDRHGRSVVGLVGAGNNGADTLYALAMLAHEGFAAAAVCAAGVTESGSAAHASGALTAAGAAGVVLHEGGGAPGVSDLDVIGEADVVLDGILGIGGRAGLPDWARPWIDAVDATAWVIAVDVPSGQDPAGGELDPDGVFADESVTFGSPKPVHLLPPTEAATGRLTVVDIGLDLRSDVPVVERLTRDDVADLWPTPDAADDKYTRGVLGLIAGGETYAGAAVLAATAAVSTGVGMLRYVGTPTPTDLVRSAVPEAVIGMGRVQAWVVGPGVDITATDDAAQAHLAAAWEALDSDLPVVVDAGGLDLIEGPRPGPTLLTPHAGECARLLARLSDGRDAYAGAFADVTAHDVQDAPVEHARALARLAHATVLLKGATTLVVTPDDGVPVRSQADAPAWLATAGAGDVLAGIIGALAAGGLDLPTAGALGALVHGVAADDANPGGPIRARNVALHVPRTVAALLSR